MRLKQRPEDFEVSESWRFDDDPRGATLRLPDGQAEALDLRGGRPDLRALQDPARGGELLRPQGQAGADDPARRDRGPRDRAAGAGPAPQAPRPDAATPLSAANTTSNRFAVTVRDLSEEDVARLPAAIAEVRRLGVVNYFDSQRFGVAEARPGLHREGPHARRLRGRAPQRARPALGARPLGRRAREGVLEGALGRVGPPQPLPRRGAVRGGREVAAHAPDRLPRRAPADRAALAGAPGVRVPELALERGGEAVPARRGRRSQRLVAIRYQAGTLLFPRELDGPQARLLRDRTFPLLAPATRFEDPASSGPRCRCSGART